jgi:hypothetical protein
MKGVSDLGANGYAQPPKPDSTPESIQAGQDAAGAMKRDIQNKAAANPDYGKLSLQASSRLSPFMADAGLTEKDVPLLGSLKDQSAQQERGKERQIMADATTSNNAATNEQREADRLSREQIAKDTLAERALRDKEMKGAKLIPDDLISGLAEDYNAGKLTPIQMQRQISSWKDPSARLRVESEIKKGDPGFSFARDEGDFKRLNSSGASQQLRAIETFIPNVDRLQSAIAQAPNIGNKWLNQQIRGLGVQFGDKTATDIKSLVGILSTELGASTTGSISASDMRLQHAVESLNAGSPQAAAISALDLLRDLELNRHANVAKQGGKFGKEYFNRVWGEDAGNKIWDAVQSEQAGAAGKFGKSNKDVGLNAPTNIGTVSDDDIIAKYTKAKK